jgi:hypothetical protein
MEVGNDMISVAISDIQLQKKDRIYQLTNRTTASGLFALFNQDELIEITTLDQKPERFYPIHYQYTNTQPSKTDTVSYDFDYDKKTVTHHKNGQTKVIELHDHAYCPNSIVLGVITWLKEQPMSNKKEVPVTRSFYYHDHYRAWSKKYTIGKEEILHLPYGKVKAIKIYPEKVKGEVDTNIWISVDKGYIPVKIEQIKNGKLAFKMELKQIF